MHTFASIGPFAVLVLPVLKGICSCRAGVGVVASNMLTPSGGNGETGFLGHIYSLELKETCKVRNFPPAVAQTAPLARHLGMEHGHPFLICSSLNTSTIL